MEKKLVLTSLLFFLSVFGDSRPGLAASWTRDPADILHGLEKEGWQEISPGVLQRTPDHKVETLGFGAEGLRFRIEKLEVDLAFLRQEYARHPSRELRRAIRAHRVEILRSEAALKKADSSGRLESASEAIVAWTNDCPAHYDASAYAFPLAQGAGASASASFSNDCGYTGEVYVQTYTTVKAADGTTTIRTKNDPETAPNTSWTGGNVKAVASVNAEGSLACYSFAYASVITYDLGGITYAVSARNGDATLKNGQCSGNGIVQPFAADAASNLRLPNSPPLDPNSAAIVANLNSGLHKAHTNNNGRIVYNASAGTPRTIVCTQTGEGTCGLSLQAVPINASWMPSNGAKGMMSVIDYTNRKIYDFQGVVTNPDGTVKVNSDGTVSTSWGDVVDLDGSGQASSLGGSNLSNLFGTVRLFEIERAASDPANAIQHALAFISSYACDTYRYPAMKSNGTSTVTGCIPVGSRIFLDSSADCSTVSPVGERAVCHALQKYGAYAIGADSAVFAIKFETPSDGLPGGSASDPYPGVGLGGGGYDMTNIPWSQLKVAADCRCSFSNITLTEDGFPTEGRPFAQKAPSNLRLPNAPPLDPNSAAIVANLNSGLHKAHTYNNGRTVYDASAGTPRTIICTQTGEVACGLSLQPVPINASWKPSNGAKGIMSVIDYVNRKIYDFQGVVTNPDGTVKINGDGTVSTSWGDVVDLDGSGQASALGGSNLSNLFGTVRVFEMERAASDPANAIQHALAFVSSHSCDTYRYPATKSNGTSAIIGCVPVGSRVFLDSSADCSTVSPVGERAICHALQKYGAYAIGADTAAFAIKFETPGDGLPGGSASDPYPGVGLGGGGYDMINIPWSQLKVAADCQCTPY